MMSFILLPAAEIDDCSNHSNHSNHYVVEFGGWMLHSHQPAACICARHVKRRAIRCTSAVVH